MRSGWAASIVIVVALPLAGSCNLPLPDNVRSVAPTENATSAW